MPQAGTNGKGDYHVIVAVGAQGQLVPLVKLGCALAAARGGHVTLLHVSPTGLRPDWLSPPDACYVDAFDVRTRQGREPAQEILAAVRQDPPDLLLLGWRGEPGKGRYLVGRTLDPLVQFAPCDLMVVRTPTDQPDLWAGLDSIQRVLIPAAGGPNAALAIHLALALSPDAQITALNVARDVQGEVALTLGRERLAGVLEPWSGEPRITGKVVQSSSVIKGILAEAAQGYDLVMIGSSHESYLDRVLFGNVPQTVAARSAAPAVIVRRRTRRLRMGTWLRRTGWRLFEILPSLDLREQKEVYKAIREGAEPKVDFFVMIGLSAAIASLGLLLNSPAVIIGAMLVAPLMAAIFGLSLGVVRGDLRLLRRAASATIRGMFLAIVVGLALTLSVPQPTLGAEVLSRTQPNLLDLGVALASGAAGAYALCRKEVSASLPGVAIAAALVPPLATVGIGIAEGRGAVAGGALLLFATNLVAITAAGGLVFLWLGFRPIPGVQARARVFQGGILGTIVLLMAVSAALGLLTAHSVRDAILRRTLERAIQAEVNAMNEGQPSERRLELDSWQLLPSEENPGAAEPTAQGNDTLRLQVWIRSPRTVAHREVVDLQERLAGRLGRTVALLLSVVPTTRLDPFVPPTPTPTPPPGATATFTPSPTATPTWTPTPTTEPTDTPSPTPTATQTPTPTPTATPTPTPTPTDTPTATPTPTPVRVEVGGTGGQGVWMYTQPGFEGGRITAWKDRTVLTLTGETVEAKGFRFVQVIDPRGRLGWIPERYLIRLGRAP